MKQGKPVRFFLFLRKSGLEKKQAFLRKKSRLLSLFVLKNHAESGKQSRQHHDADH